MYMYIYKRDRRTFILINFYPDFSNCMYAQRHSAT